MDNDIDLFLNLDGHKKLLLLPNYYYNSRTIGDIITKIQDISYVKEFFIKVLLLIPVNTVLLVVSTLILLNINKKLFLIFVIVVILYVLVMKQSLLPVFRVLTKPLLFSCFLAFPRFSLQWSHA